MKIIKKPPVICQGIAQEHHALITLPVQEHKAKGFAVTPKTAT